MVALLWDRGEIEAAIALETLWNHVSERHEFALFCAYAMSSLETSGDLGATKRMCEQHSGFVPVPDATERVLPTVGASGDRHERMFIATPTALHDVRRFVRDALAPWLDDEGLADAEIVVSELATNAVRHARSPFRVGVSVAPAAIRIAVRDATFALPERVGPEGVPVGGRGIVLVVALARDWGAIPEPDGKTVWAEIAR
jgi:anti-sigma regulatory factor (Ser/Thr protein kinase)